MKNGPEFIPVKILGDQETKNNLYKLDVLNRIMGEGIDHKEMIKLIDIYDEHIHIITSELSHNRLTEKGAKEWILEIEDISDIDKEIINFIISSFIIRK